MGPARQEFHSKGSTFKRVVGWGPAVSPVRVRRHCQRISVLARVEYHVLILGVYGGQMARQRTNVLGNATLSVVGKPGVQSNAHVRDDNSVLILACQLTHHDRHSPLRGLSCA